MTNPIARRDFLAGSLAAGTAATLASDTVEAKPRRKAAQGTGTGSRAPCAA